MLEKEVLDKIRKSLPSDWYEKICKIIGTDRSQNSIRMVLSDPQRNKSGKHGYVIDAAIEVAEAYQAELKLKEAKINNLQS